MTPAAAAIERRRAAATAAANIPTAELADLLGGCARTMRATGGTLDAAICDEAAKRLSSRKGWGRSG